MTKALKAKLRDLEAQQASGSSCMVVIISGGKFTPSCGTATIPGVGQLRPFVGETESQFCERAYATSWAGQPLEELTPERRAEALAHGAETARTSKTIQIGGSEPAGANQ